MVKETGKNQLELRYKQLKKLVRQIAENYIEITWQKPQKEQLQRMSNDHVNYLYRSYKYSIPLIENLIKLQVTAKTL